MMECVPPQRGYSCRVSPSENPGSHRHLLITAGPTHEPIDSVRYIGNRSSGRLGIELARAAAEREWKVTLLLGPTSLVVDDPRVHVKRFRTVSDLESLLHQEFPRCDCLVMAAAVADYRPVAQPGASQKIKRGEGKLTIELEATPDLLAAVSTLRRPGQVLIGFALEPEDRLMQSARDKLERKGVDAVVANPLETMDAPDIRATLVRRGVEAYESTPGAIPKMLFAPWLLDRVDTMIEARRQT